jgi:plastocyanin
MPLPRIVLVVPLLLLGMYLPAAGSEPNKPPPGALGMTHEHFTATEVDVRCGQTLTMENDSRWAHIIGPGQQGLLDPNGAVPIVRRELMETNDVYTTGAWTKPGTYYLTCAVHPKMNVKVVVSDCCC